jgi:TetR/AcrR family transcriptional regulator, transcriptional repressor for nem operon
MPRKKDPAATRARILQSAGEEFRRSGMQAARLNAIVEQADITKGSLFHHFAGKDDLALQWLRETVPPILHTQWTEPLTLESDPLAALKTIFRSMAQTIESQSAQEFHGNPLMTLTASVSPNEPALHQALQEIHGAWHRSIADALANGQKESLVHPAINPAEEAHLILSMAIGMELHAKTHGSAMLASLLRSAYAYLDTLRPA